ncbi:MAG: hypothetical protein DI566_05715 [Microbacterium sp.]|nr:MAG: hypothetical protein DI566_05715 [Microbacterium sp.]
MSGMAPPSARRSPAPASPRVSEPDLPPELQPETALGARADVFGAALDGLGGDVSVAHGRLAESRLERPSVDRFDATGATFVDVLATEPRAIELVLRDATWRNVTVTGGRIGTLDGLRSSWDSVALRGIRVDYLSLPAATLADVLIEDCEIGTLDLPDAHLTRVRFVSSRAEEVDTRGLHATDLDLRGLEALSFTDPRALAGAWFEPRQAELHAPAWAAALGIRIAP